MVPASGWVEDPQEEEVKMPKSNQPVKVKKCFGTIMNMNLMPGSMFVLGNQFMKDHYTVWDRDNERIAIAHSKPPALPQK